MSIDLKTDFGVRVERRLREEAVIWLVTTAASGSPEPSPVWFLWNGETLLIYSQPDKPKVRNIERQPRVALHFDTDGSGGDVVVLRGEARIANDLPRADQVPAYVAKYAAQIPEIGHTAESMAREYSVPIEVRPTRMRGF